MRYKKHLLTFSFVLVFVTAFAQERFSVRGYISDAETGEKLIGASLEVDTDPRQATFSNEYGFYTLALRAGVHELRCTYTGYEPLTIRLSVRQDTIIALALSKANTLREVVIEAEREPHVQSPIMGLNQLSVQEIKKIPVIFGEKDVLKTIQLLPGVISGGEGSSGFFVRGGTMDQNLILLDEAVVFNASHLFGFFSTFNSDAIKEASLYKGGMPAQYGGRLSSVLDIRTNDGNSKEYRWKGGVGLIASRLSFEGPIQQGKGSFMMSGRRTYADMFLRLSADTAIKNSLLYFYDLNFKSNYRMDDRNTLFLSGYLGKDVMGYSDLFGFNWGNSTATLRWNHLASDRLFSNTSLIYSDFKYDVNVMEDESDFSIAASVRNFNFKQDFQYFINPQHHLRFGLQLMHQKIVPTSIQAAPDAQVLDIPAERRRGVTSAAYFSHRWTSEKALSVEYGFRFNSFWALGPGRFHHYDADGNITKSDVLETSAVAARYISLEPRLSARFKWNDPSSIKLSYNRNVQNLHLLSNSSSSLPIDVWIMSSNNIKPETVNQVALGYYRDLEQGQYEFSVESYYKAFGNQIDLKNGADIQANPLIEADLLYGSGRAYGLELFLKKRRGRFTGWASYTLSKSERRFDAINGGAWFNAKQDRTHDVSLVAMYQVGKRLGISSTFVFSTGNAVTFPSGKYYLEGQPVWYYSARNEYRMPNYHRLDLGVSWEAKPNKRFQSSWEFGVYNVYNRKNAYLIDFRTNEADPRKTEAYQISLFGIIPAITWNFTF